MQSYKYDGSKKFNIKTFDCADTGNLNERHEAIREFTENLEKINEYQQRLFADQKEGIIFVFQAMDAAGKDGAVRAVLSCLSPQGVSEHSFKVPSAEENRHDYLWRFWSSIPEKGSISILNRSYYEDVLVQRVHKYYEKNRYADRIDLDTMIDKRYEEIRNFEKYLYDNSIRVIKIFLNVSKNEQANRFISRIDTQKKNWKFSSSDIDERAYWDDYMEAYEICINRTARKSTPWYVVPADHKWYARLIISRIVLDELRAMDPQWPVLSDEEKQRLVSYREMLMNEGIELAEPEKDEPDLKVKPSATAVGIALKSDRMALSEKKFRKILKKSVFENFSERFGVSEETQRQLGRIYLDYEEIEAKAEADDIKVLKNLYGTEKVILKESLDGYGKEARKLFERYKKQSKGVIDAFSDEINIAYSHYEDTLKQLMMEYEISVGSDNADPEDALNDYEQKIRVAFDAHRTAVSAHRDDAEKELSDLSIRYTELGKAFCPLEELTEEEAVIAEPSYVDAEEEIAEVQELEEAEQELEPVTADAVISEE